MADLNLNKMFVLVPNTSAATIDSIVTASEGNNKIYFVEKYNQIVAKGTVYGVDPASSNKLTTLLNSLGATVAADGTVTFDWTGFNYATKNPADTLLAVLKKIDNELFRVAAIADKIDAGINGSKTLKWEGAAVEFSGSIKYVAAAESVPAHIALVDEDNKELSTINVSDIVGNGVLKKTDYSAETGILTLTFAQANGTEKAIEVNLKAMLDINDISIAAGSQKYLEVTLGTAEVEGETQAVFGVKIVAVAQATTENTGLADAKDVKDYVDKVASDLAITAKGDDYVRASVDPGVDNKHVIVATNVKDITATDGSIGIYDTEGAQTTAPTLPTITGEAKSLVDGEKAAIAIKTYVDGAVAIEAARADAKVLASIKALDKANNVSDANYGVTVQVDEVDGKIEKPVVSVTPAVYTVGNQQGTLTENALVDSKAFVDALADMWETYNA